MEKAMPGFLLDVIFLCSLWLKKDRRKEYRRLVWLLHERGKKELGEDAADCEIEELLLEDD
jgi:hypothetical protein